MTKIEKHPSALWPICIIHTLERFGFWGMRSLLILFLIESVSRGGMAWTEQQGIEFMGFFAGCLYITPIVGGRIADKWLGAEKSIVLGGILMTLGIVALTQATQFFLGVSLVAIALGNGLFKPCITALLGECYGKDHPLRDKGYQYFYVTVLVGVLGSAALCGWIMPYYGFVPAFAVAASATAMAIVVFLIVPKQSWPHRVNLTKDAPKGPLTVADKNHIAVIAILALFAIVFFAAQTQGGGLMMVYIHRYTNRTLWGWEIPTLWLGTLGTVFGIILTPVYAALWTRWEKRNPRIFFVHKLSVGLLLTSTSFLVMMGAAWQRNLAGVEESSLYWLLGYHIAYISGKVVVTPILWSIVEKLSPSHYKYFFMGGIMGCISIGNIVGGQLGGLIADIGPASLFLVLVIFCAVPAMGLFAARRKIASLL
ncbi:MAG: peptide MFS transporter [Chlamydiota bacterium]